MALDDVALLSMVVVVAKSRFHGKVGYRRVAYGVPSMFHQNCACTLVLDDSTADGEEAVLLHLDSIRLPWRYLPVTRSFRSHPPFLVALVGHCQRAS